MENKNEKPVVEVQKPNKEGVFTISYTTAKYAAIVLGSMIAGAYLAKSFIDVGRR